MVPASMYTEIKARMPAIKDLFQSRHYIQCATECERLLTRSINEIHPMHLAYLHFYLALSHDTLARETSMRNRSSELDLAEKHYLAAIAVLTPPDSQLLEDSNDSQSPTSINSRDEFGLDGRRASNAASIHSEQSTTSSTTSFADQGDDESDCEPTPKRSNYFKRSPPSRGILDDFTISPQQCRKRPSPIATSVPGSSESMVPEDKLSTGVSSMLRMVQMHLTNVRELKETPPAPIFRFSYSRSRSSTLSSTLSSRPVSRDSTNSSDAEVDQLRWSRRTVNFRPRFDPTSVRDLCSQALSEL
ncbi:hypothetical protein BDV95DRAFT_603740 [Massariosphaeria phaeospora]|uniref:Uncharacterized protein n=1 Tax=Massariosphaeria phaeospora TaxID=100035 RepID=A0A7C8MJP4_9PLEO|nr:hypothetical protein BDV95DRAFT_603740 [Massariosphaeria phaeospora]